MANLAELRLSPEARAEVNRLLKLDRQYTLAGISSCADEIRAAPHGRASGLCGQIVPVAPPNSDKWHYIDLPLSATAEDIPAACPASDCITARLQEFAERLRTAPSDDEKRVALLFLVHLAGDIHQPLHAAERECDHGGNAELVDYHIGHQHFPHLKLHAVWDTSLVEKAMKDAGNLDEAEFTRQLDAAAHGPKTRKWAGASVDQMALDSNQLAAAKVYRGISPRNFCGPTPDPPLPETKLTENYEQAGVKIVRTQLEKAGVRLAALIEKALRPR